VFPWGVRVCTVGIWVIDIFTRRVSLIVTLAIFSSRILAIGLGIGLGGMKRVMVWLMLRGIGGFCIFG
jgi:hypothetical protein